MIFDFENSIRRSRTETTRYEFKQGLLRLDTIRHVDPTIIQTMLVRLTPKSTRFGDDFVGTLAHWMLARLSPLHFGCCHEPVYSPSYVGATACPLIPSNDRNALNG
jgi:hypothetical protein